MAVAQRYFDDLEIGNVFHSFARTLTEPEIIDFAWAYDPQPFHISAEGGAQSMFGAIIASGLQTLAIASRLGLRPALPPSGSRAAPESEPSLLMICTIAQENIRVCLDHSPRRTGLGESFWLHNRPATIRPTARVAKTAQHPVAQAPPQRGQRPRRRANLAHLAKVAARAIATVGPASPRPSDGRRSRGRGPRRAGPMFVLTQSS